MTVANGEHGCAELGKMGWQTPQTLLEWSRAQYCPMGWNRESAALRGYIVLRMRRSILGRTLRHFPWSKAAEAAQSSSCFGNLGELSFCQHNANNDTTSNPRSCMNHWACACISMMMEAPSDGAEERMWPLAYRPPALVSYQSHPNWHERSSPLPPKLYETC